MSFTNPLGITNDGTYLYVYTQDNGGEIIKFNSAGVIQGGFTCTNVGGLQGIVYLSGYVYACSASAFTIRRVDAGTGANTLFTGQTGTQGTADGAPGVATFTLPQAITTDGTDLYVVDETLIRKVNVGTGTAGTVTTLVSAGTFVDPTGIFYNSSDGKLYVADSSGTTYRGISTVLATSPYTVTNVLASTNATDVITQGSNFYFSSPESTINYYTGTNAIIAGATGVAGYVDNPTGTNARFNTPRFMTLLSSNIYVSDSINNTVRIISTTSPYAVTTFYGGGPTPPIPCIPAGQRIRTLRGDVRVETVKSGDSILTPDGRSVVVKVYKTTILGNRHEAPYLIPANTFRPGYPVSDIQLSPKHKIQCGPDLWLSAEKAATLYPAITQIGRGSFIQYFHFETPDFLTDDLVVEGSVVESYGTNYCQKYLRATQPCVWSESHKAEIRVVPGNWRM